MSACFAVIGSIASTTRKFVDDFRTQAVGYFVFELTKIIEIRVDDVKITLILQKGRFLLILFFKRVLKRGNLLRNGKTQLYPLRTLKFWQSVTLIFMLRSKEVF